MGGVQKQGVIKKIYHSFEDRLVTTISVSQAMKHKKGFYLPNALVESRIPQDIETKKKYIHINNSFNINDIVVLMFGWSPKTKGVDIAYNMLNYLPNNIYNHIHLCVVTNNKEDCFNYLLQNVNACSNHIQKITFLNAIEEVFNYHKSADVFLSASRSEGFPYSILEALAVGIPVVASNIPGTKWSFAYENVYSFISEDAQDCAYAVTKCIENNNDIVNKEIADKIRKDYSITQWCDSLYGIYESIGAIKSLHK